MRNSPLQNTEEDFTLTILQPLTQFMDRWEDNEANDKALFEDEIIQVDSLTRWTTNLVTTWA